MKNLKDKLVHAFWVALFGGCLLAMAINNAGCQMIAGIGRDLTAMADGMSADSSASATAIRTADATSDSK